MQTSIFPKERWESTKPAFAGFDRDKLEKGKQWLDHHAGDKGYRFVIPLVRLHRQLNIDCEFADPADAVLLVLQHIDSKQCLMVDEIVDQRPVVIKNLDDNFVQVPGMTGASIMGDGKVSFILDVAAIAA